MKQWKDFDEYHTWLAQSVPRLRENPAHSYFTQGCALLYGLRAERDEPRGVDTLCKAVRCGSLDAYPLLGVCYAYGRGVGRDVNQAFVYWREGAEKGSSECSLILGQMYLDGLLIAENYEQSRYWLEKAVSQGCTRALCKLGRLSEEEGDAAAAYRWFARAADKGDDEGMFYKGSYLLTGRAPEPDEAEGVDLIRGAAERGNPAAQYELAIWYAVGQFAEQSISEHLKWLHKAISGGHLPAIKLLLKEQEEGLFTQKSPEVIGQLRRLLSCIEYLRHTGCPLPPPAL